MKIFFIRKKHLIISFFIIFFLLSIFLLFFQLSYKEASTLELAQNEIASSEIMDKIDINGEKIAYLTFDDGPTLSVTPKILDILKQHNIKATFFVIGKYVEKHPNIVKREYEEGHYIANHGYDHNNSILYKSKNSFIEEINKTDLAIGNAIGIDNYCSHVFRFPNGFMAPNNKTQKVNALKILSEMHYTYVDWNCLNNDSERKYTNEQLLNNLKNSAKNKNTLIILMHDTKDVNNSSEVLNDSILYLKSEGYQFKNFYDIIN